MAFAKSSPGAVVGLVKRYVIDPSQMVGEASMVDDTSKIIGFVGDMS